MSTSLSQGISVYMSTLTLTCIAVDRYIAIVHPLRPRMENRTAYTLAAVVNGAALVFTAPYSYYMTVASVNGGDDGPTANGGADGGSGEEGDGGGPWVCTESWDGAPRTAYGAFTNITQFVLPFTTIFVCYRYVEC